MEKRGGGTLCLSLAAVFMATNGLFVKPLSNELSVADIVALRFILGLLVVCLFMKLARKRIATHDMRTELTMGAVGGITVLLYFHSMATVGVSVAVILLYTAPFFATLLSGYIIGERHNRKHALGLIGSFMGMVLILKPGFTMDIHLLAALGAGALFGLKMVLNRRLGSVDSAWTMTFYYLLIPSLIFLPYLVFNSNGLSMLTGENLILLAGLVLLSTAIGFLLQHEGFRSVRVTEGSVIMEGEAVIAVSIGVLVFGEAMDLMSILGGLMVLGSGAYLNYRVF